MEFDDNLAEMVAASGLGQVLRTMFRHQKAKVVYRRMTDAPYELWENIDVTDREDIRVAFDAAATAWYCEMLVSLREGWPSDTTVSHSRCVTKMLRAFRLALDELPSETTFRVKVSRHHKKETVLWALMAIKLAGVHRENLWCQLLTPGRYEEGRRVEARGDD